MATHHRPSQTVGRAGAIDVGDVLEIYQRPGREAEYALECDRCRDRIQATPVPRPVPTQVVVVLVRSGAGGLCCSDTVYALDAGIAVMVNMCACVRSTSGAELRAGCCVLS